MKRANQVDREIESRVSHRFWNKGCAGEVEDRIGADSLEMLGELRPVSKITFNQLSPSGHGGAVATPKVIDDDNRVTGLK